MLSLNSKEK